MSSSSKFFLCSSMFRSRLCPLARLHSGGLRDVLRTVCALRPAGAHFGRMLDCMAREICRARIGRSVVVACCSCCRRSRRRSVDSDRTRGQAGECGFQQRHRERATGAAGVGDTEVHDEQGDVSAAAARGRSRSIGAVVGSVHLGCGLSTYLRSIGCSRPVRAKLLSLYAY